MTDPRAFLALGRKVRELEIELRRVARSAGSGGGGGVSSADVTAAIAAHAADSTDVHGIVSAAGLLTEAEAAVQYLTPAGAASVYLTRAAPLVSDYLDLPAGLQPAIPPAGRTRLYARSRAGRILPEFVGPFGVDSSLQPALFRNRVTRWVPGSGTGAAISDGVNWTVSATQAHPAITVDGTLMSQMRRATHTTGTTSGNMSGVRSGAPVCCRGNAAGLGGFFYAARLGFVTVRTDMQFFHGLSAQTGALGGDPSGINDTIGIAKDATDSQLQLVRRDNVGAVKVSLGVAAAPGMVLDLLLYAPPNATTIGARVVRLDVPGVLLDNVIWDTSLPRNTVVLTAHHAIRTTAAAAVSAALSGIYIETDT